MNEEEFLDNAFLNEGDKYGDQTTRPPIDQPTGRGGITLPVLTEYQKRPATIVELRSLTHLQAREIVRWKFRQLGLQYKISLIRFEPLRLQMLDFAYNSGPFTAVRWLQRVLRVEADGVLGPLTLKSLENSDQWLVNQALIGARLQMIDIWTDHNARAKAWEEGLESRGLRFSLLEV